MDTIFMISENSNTSEPCIQYLSSLIKKKDYCLSKP